MNPLVQKAIDSVRQYHPEVNMVVFTEFGWTFMEAETSSIPEFNPNIDLKPLQEAYDSVKLPHVEMYEDPFLHSLDSTVDYMKRGFIVTTRSFSKPGFFELLTPKDMFVPQLVSKEELEQLKQIEGITSSLFYIDDVGVVEFLFHIEALEIIQDYMCEIHFPYAQHKDIKLFCTERCTCGNPEMGFDCVCEFRKKNPGSKEFSCEFCGLYTASVPRCNKCEENPTTKTHEEISRMYIRDDQAVLSINGTKYLKQEFETEQDVLEFLCDSDLDEAKIRLGESVFCYDTNKNLWIEGEWL